MSPAESATSFDVIVVGAAQRLLQAHPETQLAILERDYCVGGVWSKRRNYPSFWTQWTHGIAEFSDMPMERPPPKDCMNDLFLSKYTTKYLEDYVDNMHHGHDGKTIQDRIQFHTDVHSIKKMGRYWQLSCIDTNSKCQRLLTTVRLMMANGQSSVPNMPNFHGKEQFQGSIVHSIDFGQSSIIQDDTIQEIAVIGAGKSAADMVYEAVKANKTVSWIIRKTGDGLGAAAFAPIDLPTPYKNGVEASQARVMASLQPCYLISNTWWSWLLHSTGFGAKLVSKLFAALDRTVRNYAGYRERKSDKGFEKLKYDNDIIWQNGTAGGCHFADFWPLVAEKVYVHRANVKSLGKAELYLDDGTHFPCDAVLCGTGWQHGFHEKSAKWGKLIREADARVLKRFIMLRNPPQHYHKSESRTPYRLYQVMAPVHDDSILFMNHIVAGVKLFVAEAQAIWAVAYWDKAFQLPSVEKREKDIAHMIAWNKRQYLSNGELGHFAAFDSVPYVDRLLDEIGLTSYRRKGLLGNMFAPIMPTDLGKVWQEYLARQTKG
ncbi:putative dimethylaniline monooxygenase [Xylariaceae sp. FL0255]|nr:putative dimethylaniline monooxygenase [Xylariaceae sp. FL0255]